MEYKKAHEWEHLKKKKKEKLCERKIFLKFKIIEKKKEEAIIVCATDNLMLK